ncbi:MAG: RsmG family class I SAM-dependent methyltransferase [Ghiorsea sp.]
MDEKQLIYCNEVMRFRKVLNLTSIKDVKVFYQRFILSSLELQKWIHTGDVILDIGSGMGVPGLPLVIDRDDVSGIMVERRKKRTEFIRHVVRKMKLDADVYDADINDLPPLKATVCVARAVADIQTLLQMSDKHIVTGGRAVLPVPNSVVLPGVDGWVFRNQETTMHQQTVVCYEKV